MIKEKRVLAVIQARGGSKGIPKKNIYPIAGHPLISYTIAAARNSKYIDRLVVSTDSEEIAGVARDYGAEAPFLRPAELAGDTIASVDSLHHATLESERHFNERYDIIVELPCVAPLRNSADINGALEKLVETGATSVISMANTGEKHPVRLKRIVNDQIADFCKEFPEPAKGSRRQDLEPCYIRNGAIYSMTRHALIDLFTRHGPDSRPYEMPEERSVNIDGWMDLRIVDLMIRDGQCDNRPAKVASSVVETFGRATDPHILVTTPLYFMPAVKQEIASTSHCTFAHGASAEDVAKLLETADGWLCSPSPTYRIDEKVLRNASRLRIIATPSTGSTHIDLSYCANRGIKVVALKGTPVIDQVYASSEFSLALMMAVVRRLPQSAEAARNGQWREVEARFRGMEFEGRTLGIIGYGRIGSNLGRYANALRMKVVAYDPFKQIADGIARQAQSAFEVLAAADIVAICVHLDDSTRGMVTGEWFTKMKDGAYFLNTSRGEIIDEDALIGALESGKLAAAGVDVISGEQAPDLRNHKLIRYAKANDRLIVTPHIAGLTVESETKTARQAYAVIREALGLDKT